MKTTAVLLNVLLLALPAASSAETVIRVAVFQGDGVGGSCDKLIQAVKSTEQVLFRVSRITAEQIRKGDLSRVDVLVHPGGSASRQGKALGAAGRLAIREFVREGGGYLGVCAGAYLATNDYSWSLDLIDAKVVDRKHWARGKGRVTLRLSPRGREFFQHDAATMSIFYAQGPLLARREWDQPDVPDYESLAVFASEVAKNGAPQGVMVGTSAAVRADYGKGRVFCFSPHPELTDGREQLISIVVRWLAAR